jgi:PAS domain-containing protein
MMGNSIEDELKISKSMLALSTLLISQTSLDEFSYRVLETAKCLTESKYGFVGYLDPQTGYLNCPTMNREIWDECQVPDKTITFEKFHGLWGWVLGNKASILCNDPQTDSRATGTPSGHIPIRRFLSAPALIADRLIGLISLANAHKAYDQTDLDTIEQLAAFYALAVDRMLSEKALQQSEEKFRSLIATMREGLCLHELIYDHSGNAVDYVIVDVNPSYESILGIKKEAVIGRKASTIYGTNQPTFLEVYAPVAASGQSVSFETYFPPMDKYFSISVFSPRSGQFATVFTDITAHKKLLEQKEKLIGKLREAGNKIKTLRGLLPICASCKKIRDDQGYWQQIELYVRDRSEADFSHGICPECAVKLYPGIYKK